MQFVNRWNQLDKDTIEASSLNTFKNRLAKLRLKRMDFIIDFSLHSPLAGSSASLGAAHQVYVIAYDIHLAERENLYSRLYVWQAVFIFNHLIQCKSIRAAIALQTSVVRFTDIYYRITDISKCRLNV